MTFCDSKWQRLANFNKEFHDFLKEKCSVRKFIWAVLAASYDTITIVVIQWPIYFIAFVIQCTRNSLFYRYMCHYFNTPSTFCISKAIILSDFLSQSGKIPMINPEH